MGPKKTEKGKKDEVVVVKEEVLPTKIDFSKDYIGQVNPIYVKIKHKKESFVIFTDEFKKSYEIKEELARIKNLTMDNIKLYYGNKRPIEDDTMNHDQQIKHTSVLYMCVRNSNNEWENINDIISYKGE
jgi:hypothetical protein